MRERQIGVHNFEYSMYIDYILANNARRAGSDYIIHAGSSYRTHISKLKEKMSTKLIHVGSQNNQILMNLVNKSTLNYELNTSFHE